MLQVALSSLISYKLDKFNVILYILILRVTKLLHLLSFCKINEKEKKKLMVPKIGKKKDWWVALIQRGWEVGVRGV